jgi:hypothetical protein
MDIIKIKRLTIERNENRHFADRPIYLPNGQLHVDFECTGRPSWCEESAYIVDWEHLDGRIKGRLVDVDNVEAVLDFAKKGKESGQDFSATMRRDDPIEVWSGIDDPEYFYEYDNESPVTCSNCVSTMPIKNLESIVWVNDDGDDVEFDICPVCKGQDTFNYKLESVYDALKDKLMADEDKLIEAVKATIDHLAPKRKKEIEEIFGVPKRTSRKK